MLDELRVLTKRETQKLVGLSGRTWDRLEARGETPPKTRLSLHRIGYRAGDIKQWLDARRERPSASDTIDSWRPLHEAAKRATKYIFTNRASRVDAPLPPAAVAQPGITTTQDDKN